MFGFLESVAKVASSVVTVPLAAAADVVTLGGSLVDRDKPYTAEAVEDLYDNVKDVSRPVSRTIR